MFDLSKNLNAMKKLLMFIYLPFLAVSCMVDRGDEIHRTEESVTVYTAGLFYDFAYSSATLLDDALELDAYLKLTEQERLDPIYDGADSSTMMRIRLSLMTARCSLSMVCRSRMKGASGR